MSAVPAAAASAAAVAAAVATTITETVAAFSSKVQGCGFELRMATKSNFKMFVFVFLCQQRTCRMVIRPVRAVVVWGVDRGQMLELLKSLKVKS